MGKINANQVRVMSFIPQKGTPMENIKTPDRNMELKIIAILPFDVSVCADSSIFGCGRDQQFKNRIAPGQMLVTSIIPPKEGLMGAANSKGC